MSTLYPVAGAKIFIGGALSDKNSDFVVGDFSGQTWTEIDGWEQMGGFGDAAQTITTSLVNRSRDVKQKGTANAGSMQNSFALIDTDPGQLLLISAGAPSNKNSYAFRIDFPSGVKRYFVALVMGTRDTGGNANTINKIEATLEINSNVVFA